MFGKKVWGLLLAFMLLAGSFSIPAAHAATIRTGTTATTTAALNLRTGAGTNYAVRQVIPSGATVFVNAGPFNASWYQVTYSGASGYVYGTYLRQTNDGGSTGSATTTAALNLRSGPGTTYSVQLVIPAGSSVSIISGPVNGVWFKVTYAGRTGYVHGDYLARGGNGGPKQIIVDLSDQWVYAYEGGVKVFSAPTSTGKDGFNTPVGSYTVLSKYRSKTMQGSANGETWYAENVPYVLFFTNRGHALHGAPWVPSHVFGSGERRSHGCVNLPVDAAAWFYNWAPLGTPVQVRW